MRQKLCVTVLTLTLAFAGAREASRQITQLKTAVSDWTRTGAWGGLLVFAGEGATTSTPFTQPYLATATFVGSCAGEKSPVTAPVAAKPKSAPGVRVKSAALASREHAATEFATRFTSPRVKVPESALATFAGAGVDVLFKLRSELKSLANSGGAKLDVEKARAEMKHTEGSAHIALALERLARKNVLIRIARREETDAPFALRTAVAVSARPRSLVSPPTLRTDERLVAETPAEMKGEGASTASEISESEPFSFVSSQGSLSLGCDHGPAR